MIEHRWEARARLEDGMTEGLPGGSVLQLVTLCLSDDGAGEVSDELGRPVEAGAAGASRICARATRARWRSSLLELAELADRRSGESGMSER